MSKHYSTTETLRQCWQDQRRGKGEKSALDEIHEVYGFPGKAIVTMAEVVECLHNKEYNGEVIIDDNMKSAIDAYYEQYGAK